MKNNQEFKLKEEDLLKNDSYRSMSNRVVSSESIKHRFMSADIVYTEFSMAARKIEIHLKTRTVPIFLFNDFQESLVSAIDCSDKIHVSLCDHYQNIPNASNNTKFFNIIEKWADIHIKLWKLAYDYNLIKT